MLDVLFRLDLPRGRCVAVRIPPAIDGAAMAALPSEERAIAETLTPVRRPSWVAGRVALRAAAADVGRPVRAVGITDRGGPALPDELAGSISHKGEIAVGLAVARSGASALQAGVDVEIDAPLRVDVSSRVLVADETARIAGASGVERNRQILLHLSAKEALYKALDPFVHRYVGFKEAEVRFEADGRSQYVLNLTNHEGPFTVTGWWALRERVILTAAWVSSIA